MDCMESIYQQTKTPVEIIVVDNHSEDGSPAWVRKQFPWVTVLENKKNLGFAKANNLGIRLAKGKYVLLLNPDTVIKDHAVDKALKLMESRQDIGVLSVKLLKKDGSIDLTCRRELTPTQAFMVSLFKVTGLGKLFPNNKYYIHYYALDIQGDSPREVDKIACAFFLARKKVFKKTGLLDKQFFMYGEDVDLCFRVRKAGYHIFYWPGSFIIHLGGESSKKQSYRMIQEFYHSIYLFYTKHHATNPFLRVLAKIAIFVLMLIALTANIFKREKKV